MLGYLAVAAIAAVITFATTPFVRRFATRIGAVAMPGARNVHKRPTATLGGAAMFTGFLVAMAVASKMGQFHEMFDGSAEPLGVVLAAGVMFLVGALDDVREVSPPAKIAGQALAASVLSLMGVTMLYFRVPFLSSEYVILSSDVAPLVTVITVVLIANAINLIDGLDGLAAGVTLIASVAMLIYSDRLFDAGLLEGSNIAPLIAALTAGVCAGFLPWNFNPARIFMGDAGALFLGLLLAAQVITIGGRTSDQFSGQTYFFFAPLVIPLVILGVPIVDTIFSFVRRVVKRKSFATADTDHLHHRLMRLGHGPRRSVTILWLWTALLSGLVLVPTFTGEGNALVPFGVVALALLLFGYFNPGRKAGPVDGARETETDEPPVSAGAGGSSSVVDIDAHRRR